MNRPGTDTISRRWVHIFTLAYVLSALCRPRALAAPQDFAIEPVPDWTTPIDVKEYDNPLEKLASGAFILLLDTEINGATRERFIHIAEKFLSSSGVEANSRLSFNFDPSYQQLVLHRIVLHRKGMDLDQLNPSKIRIIQQEKELDRLIYNGALTALLFLEDVRVGDWVEYAYTVRGRNPIENGHFYDVLQLRWPFPTQMENYRLLWPLSSQPLWVQISGEAGRNRKVTDRFYDYHWQWENRPAQESEDFIPPSVVPYPLVHFTDYPTWKDVANWAEKSYRPPKVSNELYQKILTLRDENTADEQRIAKALQFVQDGIRYLGIESGINSHQPTDPSIVFARGYGDCKDKVLLFCTMLRLLGVGASPVLVSSRFRGRVQEFIPTPLALDHAIAQVVLTGKTNYVDVTRSFQRGPLNRRFIDDFGAGLLLDENSPGLIVIPPTNAGMPRTVLDEKFNVRTNAPTELAVTTTFEGRDADLMRQQLASFSRDSFDKGSLAYYKKRYASIVTARSMEPQDVEQLNRIQITQRYLIPNIWKAATHSNFLACEFFAQGIMDRLYVPAKKERKWPLAVLFPDNFIQRIQIQTADQWRILPSEKTIQTKSLLFHYKKACTNNQITIVCQLLPLKEAVIPGEMADYLGAIDQIPQFLGLTVTKPIPGASQSGSPNWSIWIGIVCYSVILLIAAALVYRYKPRSPPEIPLPSDARLQGLGGWLIPLALGLIAAIFLHLNLLTKMGPLYSVENWRAFTDPANIAYDALTAPLLLYELFLRLTLFFFTMLLVVLFFQKRRLFPTLFIIYLSFQFIAIALDVGVAQARKVKTVTTNVRASANPVVVQSLLPLIVWGLYLLRSKRVKLTFQR